MKRPALSGLSVLVIVLPALAAAPATYRVSASMQDRS
jgi:hypothetical protein